MTTDYERWADLSDRAAIGEPLSEGDAAFVRGYAETDPVARAEADLWDRMSALDPEGDELANRSVAERAVRAAQAEQRRASRRRRSMVWSVAGGLAAAAAAVFVVATEHRESGRGASLSVVEYLSGEARADGARLEKGTRLAVGTEVSAVSGPVCVAVEPRIHACLASGAKVRLSAVGAASRRVDLLEGRVAIALDPLPKGERFSVVANGTWSTAVGTAFTVEIDRIASTVRTIVHEGKVAVGAEHGGSVIGAHKIGLSKVDEVAVETLRDHAATETPEWAALATVAGRTIEGAPAEVAAISPKDEPAPSPAVVEAAPAAAAPAVEARSPAVTKVLPPSASELLAAARQSLRDQRWDDAATAYRRLVSAYPSTPEARTAVVPLAKVEIDRLGQPAVALPSLESYIASGGSLVVEARLARIRALRALGRAADEARAIDEFLAAHPSSLDAEKLRARRVTLGSH